MGKTHPAYKRGDGRRKHPHACGEDGIKLLLSLVAVETPPRLWGRLPLPFLPVTVTGNTPTPVGKTMPLDSSSLLSWKHPHACGEDLRESCFALHALETPPRLWGRRSLILYQVQPPGNTPTPVGKTKSRKRKTRSRGKHPHACGEDLQ